MRNISTICYLLSGGASIDVEIIITLEQAKNIIQKMKKENERFSDEEKQDLGIEYWETTKETANKMKYKTYHLIEGCHTTRVEIVKCPKGFSFKEEYIKEQKERF